MTEEFCVVTRKKWISRRSLQRRTRRISERSYEQANPDVDVDKFVKRLEDICEEMRTCDYFVQSMKTIQDSIKELQLTTSQKFERVVCFGIGPFTRNFQALHQLAFIISAQRYLNIDEAYYFDPIFKNYEKEVLQRLQCCVMSENCEAKYEANVLTLFYLPHCPNCLTNNLLWSNWRPMNLQYVVLINNSFESLSNSKPERVLRLDSGYILDALKYAKEFPLEDDYDTRNVFNDLSVHIFPVALMPEMSTSFWAQRDAPTYNDVEMISAADFAKLSIS